MQCGFIEVVFLLFQEKQQKISVFYYVYLNKRVKPLTWSSIERLIQLESSGQRQYNA